MKTSIQAHPDAPEGSLTHLSSYTPSTFVPGSAVLCRNTAPLVSFAYALLLRDVPCNILGRDIGAALTALVNRMYATSLDDLSARLTAWKDREVSKAIAEDRSTERITDQYDCLVFFIQALDERSRTIPDLISKIDLMFTDDALNSSSRVTLSTVHKSKGLEYPDVFILDFEKYMPSKFAKQPWQLVQENNLIYVAVTRAKLNLYYISTDCWKVKEEVL